MLDSTFVSTNSGENSASKLLEAKLAGKKIPWEIMFEITHKCNLKCTHCYNFDRSVGKPPKLADELNSDEIIDAIDQVIAAGCWNLCFTGGEVLVHPDIFKFIEHARSRSLRVAVKTNGVLLTPERVKRLAELGVHNVWVSFYGAYGSTHDHITAVKHSFERSLKGCEEVVKHGISLTISSVLTDHNVDEIGQMQEMAGRLNASFMITPEVTERHDGTDSSRQHLPVLDNTRKVFKKHSDLFGMPPDFNPNRFMQCGCAVQSCAIAATGDVYPCINAPMKAGNIREASFQNIWDNSPLFERIRSLKPADFKDCTGCEDKPWCARSSGTVFTNTGDYLGTDPVTCSQAKVRREVWEDTNGEADVQDEFRNYHEQDSNESGHELSIIDCPG